MDERERRKWIAGLRPLDRVTFRWGLSYLRGCTLIERRLPSDDTYWFVEADANGYGIEEVETSVRESQMEPLPHPGFTGFLDLDPPTPRRRRRAKAAAKASA